MPPRARTPDAALLSELRRRVEALEERVARLEKGKVPPGDGRASVRPPAKGVERCPGCALELRTRQGRCVECGFPIEAARPKRSPRRRA